MIELIAVVVFRKVYPARRAGSNHRENTAVLYPIQEFGRFFHNGKVGTEVSVEHFLIAQATERRDHFAGNGSSYLHTEFFAESRANRGSGLNDDVFARLERRVNSFDFRRFHKSARRTNVDTLTAHNTGRINETSVFRGSDDGLKPTVFKA